MMTLAANIKGATPLPSGGQRKDEARDDLIFLQYFDAAAYGPAVATASQTPSSLATFKFRLVLPFWYWLTQVVLKQAVKQV